MGWEGHEIRFSVLQDSHGGKRQEIGEILFQQFMNELALLLTKPKYNQELYMMII